MSRATMRAMVLVRTGSFGDDGGDPPVLEACRLPVPEPGPGEVLVRVQACGVCHTDLDQAEGRIAPSRLPVVPGHQAVGRVAALGAGVAEHRPGDRVGVGWIHASTGKADENLSPAFRATGRDADGGYAEYLTVGSGMPIRSRTRTPTRRRRRCCARERSATAPWRWRGCATANRSA